MSGRETPTLKRVWGGGGVEKMYHEMVYYNRMHVKSRLPQSTGCLKKTLWKFNRLLCIINLAKQFNFYIGRKSCYLA